MNEAIPVPSPEKIDTALELIKDMAEDCRAWASAYRNKRRPGPAATAQANCDALDEVAAYLESVKQ